MSGFPSDLRSRSLAALRDSTVDVLIIGGGINGAGVARDLTLRGVPLRVALVEQRHFASGTSGKNSQLIHGGLRYLKYLQVGLVKESLRERGILGRIAPHLVEPLAFLMPIFSRLDKVKYMMGLHMYDQLAGDANIAKHREVSKAEVQQIEPGLNTKGLVGAALFYDCMVHSARFVLENLFDAAGNGALMANYIRAEPLERHKDGNWRVRLHDQTTGDVFLASARKIVDATGAWSAPGDHPPRLVRGSHIVMPRLSHEEHAIAYFAEDGRIIFLIPWGSENQLTLVGTTDVDHAEGPDDPRISQQEIDYLISIVERLFPGAPTLQPICAYSSIRPLVSNGKSATEASREHKIWNTADGILRIQGGKYTTYRVMAEEAVDQVLKEIAPGVTWTKKTSTEPLAGNSQALLAGMKSEAGELASRYGVTRDELDHLIREYGSHTPDLLKLLPEQDYGPIRRSIYARMAFSAQHEMALRLSDFLFVSSYLGYEQRWEASALEPYAFLMGSWLGWDAARRAHEIQLALRHTALPRRTH